MSLPYIKEIEHVRDSLPLTWIITTSKDKIIDVVLKNKLITCSFRGKKNSPFFSKILTKIENNRLSTTGMLIATGFKTDYENVIPESDS